MAASSKQPYSDQRRRSQLPQLSRFTPVDELGIDDSKNDVMTTTSTTTRSNHDSTVKSHMRTSSSIRARGDSLKEQKTKDEEKRRSAQLDQSVIRPRGSSTTADTTRQLRSPTKLDRSSSIRRPGSSAASALPRSTSIRAPTSHNRSASVLESSSKSPVKTSRHNASSSADTSRGQDSRPTQLSKPVVQARVSSKPAEGDNGIECQQIELFQLSILHQSSFASMKSFSESGQKELMKKYIRLRQSLRSILDEEQEQQTMKNLDALLRWQPEQSNLIDTLHTIQRVYQDVKAMTLNGSTYGDIIVHFHVWMEEAMDCVGGKVGGKFAVPLRDKWRHSHASAALEIRSMQRELNSLPAALPPSSLASIIKSCEVLLDGMLKELDIMLMIEKTLLKLDRARVDQAVTSIRHSQPVNTQKWIPAWH